MADKIEWPKNLVIQGLLSFPLYSNENIADLAEWRVKKEIPKPQFDDKIGATLILDQANYDKAAEYLTEVYLPFNIDLYNQTGGKKGIDPDYTKDLIEQAKKRIWIDPTDKKKRPNMPIRDLNKKDIENLGDFPGVAKIKIAGPYPVGTPIARKAVVRENGERKVVPIKELVDDGVLPEGRQDPEALWWGAGWHFQTSLRFNAFDSASVGVTAYGQTLYLLPHLGLPSSGNAGDQEVLDEGDDWEE